MIIRENILPLHCEDHFKTKYYISHNKKLGIPVIVAHTLKEIAPVPNKSGDITYNRMNLDIEVYTMNDNDMQSPGEQIGLLNYIVYQPQNLSPDTNKYSYYLNTTQSEPFAYIYGYYVEKKYQQNGVGSQIFGLMEKHLVENNVSLEFLYPMCERNDLLMSMTDAERIEMYERMGFEDVGFQKMTKHLTTDNHLSLEELGLKPINFSIPEPVPALL